MKKYVFVGWPIHEAQSEAVRCGIHVETIKETAEPKNSTGKGISYVIQERWVDAQTVIFISGLRLIGEQEPIDNC